MEGGAATKVDTICTYRRNSTSPPFDRVQVYDEIINQTQGFTKMGPYTLDKNSLFVDGKQLVISSVKSMSIRRSRIRTKKVHPD